MTQITRTSIQDGMAARFLTYATYVIADRALPDARDGLKPVQRRIMYSMHKLGLSSNASYKKSARTVGDVLGLYHPHGDSSVYGAMVVMAQDFRMRYPLVNGHGNFGSMDGDSPAAMRYTEAKLHRHSDKMMADLDKDTVNFIPNFDESTMEPSVLPTLFPNLLCNGAAGIAVSLATSIPPHHAGSIYKALLYSVDCALKGEETDIEDLIKLVVAPDFPTGGTIINLSDVHKGYRTGKGRVVTRSNYEIEETKKLRQIVISEIPFKINKANLVEQIDNYRKNFIPEDIKEVRDESDKDGVRVVIDLKKDANADWVVKKLLKHTDLQSSYSINMVALVDGRPKQITLKDAIDSFLSHAAEVIMRRTEYSLKKAQARMHIVEGILTALDNIDSVIATIKEAKTNAAVIVGLMEGYGLSEAQAKAIADMKLRTVSQASAQESIDEHNDLSSKIELWNSILNDDETLLQTIHAELTEVSQLYKDERRTAINVVDSMSESDRELIKAEDLIVTITENNIIRSVPQSEYAVKGRGTKGVKSGMKENDTVSFMFSVNSRDDLLFFTNKGRCHVLEVYKLPVLNKGQAGKYMTNYISMDADEFVVNVLPKEYSNNEQDLLMATKLGTVKRLELSTLSSRMKVTKVITFKENDELVSVTLMKDQNVMLFTAGGQAIQFNPNAESSGVRPMGRTAAGVRGIKLKEDDYVITMVAVEDGQDLMLITENGIGKRVEFDQFPEHNRGGQGVRAIGLTEKTGILECALSIRDEEDLLIATSNGIVSRIPVNTIRPMGRSAAGVKVIGLSGNDTVVSISSHEREEEIEDEEENNEAE